jgi:hypothetical protein
MALDWWELQENLQIPDAARTSWGQAYRLLGELLDFERSLLNNINSRVGHLP